MNTKKTLIAVTVAIVLGGSAVYLMQRAQNSVTAHQVATPEQRAEAYATLHSQLDAAAAQIVQVFAQPEAKQASADLDAALTQMDKIAEDYVTKKNAGATTDELAPLASQFTEQVRKGKPLVDKLYALAGKQAQALHSLPLLLQRIDPDKFKAELETLKSNLAPAFEAIQPLTSGVSTVGVIVAEVNQELAPKKVAGIEVSDAEEAAAYLKASTGILDEIAAQVKAEAEHPAPADQPK